MDNLILKAYKNAYELIPLQSQYSQTVGNAGGSAGESIRMHFCMLSESNYPYNLLVIDASAQEFLRH
jgi:hypothetical protein